MKPSMFTDPESARERVKLLLLLILALAIAAIAEGVK